MIRQIEEGDTKGGIIIPKDKFKAFVEFQKEYLKHARKENKYTCCDEIKEDILSRSYFFIHPNILNHGR